MERGKEQKETKYMEQKSNVRRRNLTSPDGGNEDNNKKEQRNSLWQREDEIRRGGEGKCEGKSDNCQMVGRMKDGDERDENRKNKGNKS